MVLLALSLQDQVEKYGSYVGIAAFFGLAILSLLYFAQAREVKRLREWAGRAPERAREVEEAALAAAEAARRRPAPAAAAAAGQQAPAQPVAAATAAGGRSGTVSPAVPVGAATAVAERPEGEGSEGEEDGEPPVVEGPVTEDGKRPVAAVAPAAEAKATDEDEEPEAAERDDDDLRDEAEDADTDSDTAEGEGEEQPAPAAAAPTNGAPPAGAERPVFPRPSTAAGAAGAAGTPAPAPAPAGSGTPAAQRPAPAMPVRAAAPSASPRRAGPALPPRRPAPSTAASPAGSGGRRWAIAGGVAAVVVALGIYAATQLLGGEDTPSTPNQAATPTVAPTEDAPSSGGGGSSSASRGDTTVAVFNGTTINGLAASTADKVQNSGYKRGSTGDYTDQQRATSTVFYRRDARRQARDVARELDISDQRVMDEETQALAGERAAVAVVVGADKAP